VRGNTYSTWIELAQAAALRRGWFLLACQRLLTSGGYSAGGIPHTPEGHLDGSSSVQVEASHVHAEVAIAAALRRGWFTLVPDKGAARRRFTGTRRRELGLREVSSLRDRRRIIQ
jgi:hypothetical protein